MTGSVMEKLFDWDESTPISRIVGEAVGLASMCWEHPEKAGVFDSDLARRIVDEVLEALHGPSMMEVRRTAREP
jgi:hypothetical protein